MSGSSEKTIPNLSDFSVRRSIVDAEKKRMRIRYTELLVSYITSPTAFSVTSDFREDVLDKLRTEETSHAAEARTHKANGKREGWGRFSEQVDEFGQLSNQASQVADELDAVGVRQEMWKTGCTLEAEMKRAGFDKQAKEVSDDMMDCIRGMALREIEAEIRQTDISQGLSFGKSRSQGRPSGSSQ